MYCYYSSPTVTNCTFSGNTGSQGGGMYNYDSTPTLVNYILWWDELNEIVDNTSSATVTYSNVQGGWPEANNPNIDADPCFADVSTENLRLLPSSPGIDDGYTNFVTSDMADLDGDGNTVEPTPFDINSLPSFVDDLCTVDTGNPGTL